MDIWFADLGIHPNRCIQNGIRPILILSNDISNAVAPFVVAAPMSSKTHKLYLPTHVLVEPEDLEQDTWTAHRSGSILLEQITVVDKRQLSDCIGRVKAKSKKDEIDRALKDFLGVR